jgi:hypothetical protein
LGRHRYRTLRLALDRLALAGSRSPAQP